MQSAATVTTTRKIETLNAHQRLATKSILVSAGIKWMGRMNIPMFLAAIA